MNRFVHQLGVYAQAIELSLQQTLPHTLPGYTDKFWREHIHSFVIEGGKRLRPALAMMMADELGISSMNHVEIFTSIELVHDYLLAHDDIIDQDNLRRGRPTLHKALQNNLPDSNIKDRVHFGYAQAIIGGDVIYNLAQDTILKSNLDDDKKIKLMQLFSDTSQEVSRGWYKQFLSDYLRLSELSLEYIIQHNLIEVTSSYTFLFPFRFGQIIATGDTALSDTLRDFSYNLGILFQTGDDLIGIFGDPAKSGKSNDGDIIQGKKTIPMCMTYKHAPRPEQQWLDDKIGSETLSSSDILHIKSLVQQYGSQPTQEFLDEHTQKCLHGLESLPYSDRRKDLFRDLLEFLSTRQV